MKQAYVYAEQTYGDRCAVRIIDGNGRQLATRNCTHWKFAKDDIQAEVNRVIREGYEVDWAYDESQAGFKEAWQKFKDRQGRKEGA